MTPSELSKRLAEEAERVAEHLFPNGRREGQEWHIGSVNGDKGKSLGIHLSGNKAGIWSDFATGESGDLLDLWATSQNISISAGRKFRYLRDFQFDFFRSGRFGRHRRRYPCQSSGLQACL